MSIDPRIAKQIIQLQLAPSLDLKNNTNVLNAKTGNGQESLFDTLLSQYMKDSSIELADIPTVVTDPLSLLSNVPNVFTPTQPVDTATGSSDYDALIAQAAAKYGVDPQLIRGVIRTESGFDSDAVSSSGAKGLMQLMDATARSLGVTDSLNPQQNIEGGTKYLSYLLGKYNGNEQVALAAYNAGPGRIDRLGISTNSELQVSLNELPGETQRYLTKVQNARY